MVRHWTRRTAFAALAIIAGLAPAAAATAATVVGTGELIGRPTRAFPSLRIR